MELKNYQIIKWYDNGDNIQETIIEETFDTFEEAKKYYKEYKGEYDNFWKIVSLKEDQCHTVIRPNNDYCEIEGWEDNAF